MKLSSLSFNEAAQVLRAKRPLVHCITNGVSLNDCANLLLAVGARPVMADAPEESARITEKADALLINTGMLNRDKKQAILLSAAAAKKKGIPVLLDPVGAGASPFRMELVQQLLTQRAADILKGNRGEIGLLTRMERPEDAVLFGAKTFHCICAATGETDFFSDGTDVYPVSGGSPLLPMVTATGCMTGALTAAFLAAFPENPAFAAECGLYAMKQIGLSAAALSGYPETIRPGSFHAAIFDAAAALTLPKGDAFK